MQIDNSKTMWTGKHLHIWSFENRDREVWWR